MKNLLHLMGVSMLLLVLCGCKKDTEAPEPCIPSDPPQPSNTAPNVWLGENVTEYPFKKILLSADISDRELNIKSYRWTKISGPDAYKIETPDSLSTIISNMENGDYEFELEAKDSRGLTGKDRLLISVELKPETTNEIIFKDMVWDWGDWFDVLKIYQLKYLVEPGRPFKVFIQRDNNPEWINVQPWNNENLNYYYEVYNGPWGPGEYIFGLLSIYRLTNSESDTPTVKIVFE